LLNPDFRDMLSALRAEQVEFLIVGSYAVAAHGSARATEDIDIWVRPSAENAGRVMRALMRFGAPTSSLKAQDFQSEDLIFQMGAPPCRIDILTTIEAVGFDEAWSQRDEVAVEGESLPVISLEHLLINKRAVGRHKDLADVERLERKPKA
jgi:predicted nucleotidyltransferase